MTKKEIKAIKEINSIYQKLLHKTVARFKDLGIEDDGTLLNPVRMQKQALKERRVNAILSLFRI